MSDSPISNKTSVSEAEGRQISQTLSSNETEIIVPQTYWCHECQKNISVAIRDTSVEPCCADCQGFFIELVQSSSAYSESSTESNAAPPNEYQSARALARLNLPASVPTIRSLRRGAITYSDSFQTPVQTQNQTHSTQAPSLASNNSNTATNTQDETRQNAQNRLTRGLARSITSLFSSVMGSLDANTAERLSLDLSAPVPVIIHTAIASSNFPVLFWNNLDNYTPGNDTEAFNNLLHQLFMQSQGQGNPPASKVFITNIKANKIKPTLNEDCAVCKETWLDPHTDNTEEKFVCVLECGHKFCEECIVPWLEKRNTCPVCRLEFPTDDKEYEQERLRTRNANSQVGGTQID